MVFKLTKKTLKRNIRDLLNPEKKKISYPVYIFHAVCLLTIQDTLQLLVILILGSFGFALWEACLYASRKTKRDRR